MVLFHPVAGDRNRKQWHHHAGLTRTQNGHNSYGKEAPQEEAIEQACQFVIQLYARLSTPTANLLSYSKFAVYHMGTKSDFTSSTSKAFLGLLFWGTFNEHSAKPSARSCITLGTSDFTSSRTMERKRFGQTKEQKQWGQQQHRV